MDFLLPVLWSAPVWLLLLVGIAYSALTVGQHRSVSLLAGLALSGFLLLDLTGTLVWTAYEWFVVARGTEGLPVVLTNMFWFVQAGVHALFLSLAVAAAVVGRSVEGDV